MLRPYEELTRRFAGETGLAVGLCWRRLLRCSAMKDERPAAWESQHLEKRESGLKSKLSPRQVAMIGLGCTIGTGLFLGSAISVKQAGPAVILSFAAGALIALTVMWALAEMAVEHPAPG